MANDFINWDDPGYILENPHLARLDGDFLVWAFSTLRQGNWHPLTWLSLGIDHALFGIAPLGYHLSSVLLHSVTTLLVVLFTARLFARARQTSHVRNLVAAAVAGLLFAVHPLHVESVAWASERKDLLCGSFYIVSLLFYLQFAERQNRTQYFACLGAFALAVLSKPMAVSLPLVLLILDAYPLARLTRFGWARVMLEKAPFAAIAAASSILTIVAQSRAGAVASFHHLGMGMRLWGAEHALGFYLGKMALPIDLVPIYPIDSEASPWSWGHLLSLALVIAVTGVAVIRRRRWPLIAALWAAYVVMLLPVLGLFQVGQQAAADRYMYLPMLAPAIGIAALVGRLCESGRRVRTATAAVVFLALTGLSMLTIRQIGVWRDTPTLWRWVIQKQPNVAIAHYNLGEYLRAKGDMDGAERCWRRASDIDPSFSWPLNQLGNVAASRGRLNEARNYYERATRVNVNDAEAQYNYASFLEEQGQLKEARLHYEIFLRVAPSSFVGSFSEVREKLLLLPR